MVTTGADSLIDPMASLKLAKELLGNIQLHESPPKDFEPLKASSELLRKHGLPQRPNEDTHPQQFATWQRILSRPLAYVTPTLEIMDQEVPAEVPAEATVSKTGKSVQANSESEIWSGAVNNTLEDGYKFKAVSSSWTVSRPYPQNWAWRDWGWENGKFAAGTWVGIDGYHSSHALHAGTGQRCNTSIHQSTDDIIFPWFEWNPASFVRISGFEIRPGDAVTVQVSVTDDNATQGFIFFSNDSACTYTSVTVNAPEGTSLKGESADWIIQAHCPNITAQGVVKPTMSCLASTFMNDCWAVAEKKDKSGKRYKPVVKDLSDAKLLNIVQNGITLSTAKKENDNVLGIFGETRTNATFIS